MKDKENIFNKATEENFPNLTEMPTKKHTEHQTDWTRKCPQHTIIKTTNIQKIKNIEAARKSNQVTYKGSASRMKPDFSMERGRAEGLGQMCCTHQETTD